MVIPAQAVVYTPGGTNHALRLPFGTSLYDLKQAQMPPPADLTVRDGLRLFTPAAALVRVSETFFVRHAVQAHVALIGIQDESDLLRRLLDGGHSAFAGRLAGAFRRVGRPKVADEIVKTMKAAGYDVRENDPFALRQAFGSIRAAKPPIVGRLQAMWASMRGVVVESFPKAPGLPKKKGAYLRLVDEIYKNDAYHSLSIEGYNVTPALVERVRSGNWDPVRHPEDRQNRNALAARGYWQAFQTVKPSIAKIITGANPGATVRAAHREWHRELFQPFVGAGLLPASALAGYRNEAVFLRISRYVPPRWEAVRDAMPALFDLLEQESEPSVRAVLGHWLFGYIHPYPDGNGRMARFLMNTMLAAGGYPWTIIRVQDRTSYMNALDKASIGMDIHPFADFVAKRVSWSLKQAQRRK